MTVCSNCGNKHKRANQRYCKACHAESMRAWRKSHLLTKAQKVKDTARSYANTYLQRGKIIKQPCIKCNSKQSQMHHDDYSKPLKVIWMCRPCHLEHHRLAA